MIKGCMPVLARKGVSGFLPLEISERAGDADLVLQKMLPERLWARRMRTMCRV